MTSSPCVVAEVPKEASIMEHCSGRSLPRWGRGESATPPQPHPADNKGNSFGSLCEPEILLSGWHQSVFLHNNNNNSNNNNNNNNNDDNNNKALQSTTQHKVTWPSVQWHCQLTFRHRASCILGQAFHYSPENAFYIFNQQIYFIIWYLLDRASLI